MMPTPFVGVPGTATSEGVAMPEFLTRRDSDGGSWVVGQGTPTRGDAWTDLTERHMRVPFGDTPLARVIRAHEMAHAKASPASMADAVAYCGVSPDIVAACEEVRVNELVKIAGFNIDLLTDGSEKMTGAELAKMGRAGWNGVVKMVTATANTKACNALIAGIRSIDRDMASAASEVRKAIRKFTRETAKYGNYGELIGSTAPHHLESVNIGFAMFTEPLAKLVNSFLVNDGETTQDGDEIDGDPSEETLTEIVKRGNGGVRGKWAKLIVDDSIVLSKRVDGKMGRKRIASDTGRNPRRISRLLTDPEKRVFDRHARGKGGVILIDQSGSMHLNDDHLMQIIEAAPGCVVIGYSHERGSTGVPNVWILANRGKVAESVRSGNGGNGVDGPALRFALAHRRAGEAFVWICDGAVTDGAQDCAYPNLENECAALVVKHRIHMVADIDDAIIALRRVNTGERLRTKLIGAVRQGHGRIANLIGS